MMDDEMFEELVESIKQMKAIMRGEMLPSRVFVAPGVEVKSVRAKYKLSQRKFAAMLGISVRTLQNWEQGRRSPEGPARILLLIAAKHPEAVLDVVGPIAAD
jgi:putative transcriptional regulator